MLILTKKNKDQFVEREIFFKMIFLKKFFTNKSSDITLGEWLTVCSASEV